MSKSSFFQEHVLDIDTSSIYEKILSTFDFHLLEENFNIEYKKFPNDLPDIDEHIKILYNNYYNNLLKDGYNYDNTSDIYIDKYLSISPKFQRGTRWVKGIRQKKIISNALNMHIFLNNPDVNFEYFCPFNDDIVTIKCEKNKVVIYPHFWGSLFKHLTFDTNVVYMTCVIGSLQ